MANLQLFVLFFAVVSLRSVVSEDFVLDVIHINDFHARYDEINSLAIKCKSADECIGGYARTIGTVKRLQQEVEHPLFLNAGDNYMGTLWYDLFKWNITSQLLNLHDADAIVSARVLLFGFDSYLTVLPFF